MPLVQIRGGPLKPSPRGRRRPLALYNSSSSLRDLFISASTRCISSGPQKPWLPPCTTRASIYAHVPTEKIFPGFVYSTNLAATMSLLNRDNPFVASRPPICDGAGSVSSADHSLPSEHPLSQEEQGQR